MDRLSPDLEKYVHRGADSLSAMPPLLTDGSALVHWLANHIHDAAQGLTPHRHLHAINCTVSNS